MFRHAGASIGVFRHGGDSVGVFRHAGTRSRRALGGVTPWRTRAPGGALLGLLGLFALGCDVGGGRDADTVGPPVRVLGVNVGDRRPLPADGVIEIAFDRYLLPSSVNRQSLFVVDGAKEPLPPAATPLVQYDPIARTVTLRGPTSPWLTEGLPYSLVLGVPDGDAELGGVRALDRATLAPDQPREIAFFAGPPSGEREPGADLCRDVLPIFAAKCSAASCHGHGPTAAAGLVLDSPAAISRTAIDKVARGANTGSLPTAREPDRVFGVDMPIIQPGDPGNSWLLYKVEIAARPTAPSGRSPIACERGGGDAPLGFTPRVPAAALPPSPREHATLSDFVLGLPMPLVAPSAPVSYATTALTFEEREAIRRWIQGLDRGAGLPDCGLCRATPDASP